MGKKFIRRAPAYLYKDYDPAVHGTKEEIDAGDEGNVLAELGEELESAELENDEEVKASEEVVRQPATAPLEAPMSYGDIDG
jgi:hypothetical protein